MLSRSVSWGCSSLYVPLVLESSGNVFVLAAGGIPVAVIARGRACGFGGTFSPSEDNTSGLAGRADAVFSEAEKGFDMRWTLVKRSSSVIDQFAELLRCGSNFGRMPASIDKRRSHGLTACSWAGENAPVNLDTTFIGTPCYGPI